MSRLLWAQRKDFGPTPRHGAVMAYDQKRKRTILFGHGGGVSPGERPAGDTWLWDGDGWIQVADTGPNTGGGAAALIYDPVRDKTVLYGMLYGEGTWEWNGANWVQVASQHHIGPRLYSRGAWDSKRQRLVAVAEIEEGPCLTWEWNNPVWTQVSDAGPPWRYGFDVAYDDERQKLVLFGGRSSIGSDETWFTDTRAWDGDSWEQVSDFGPGPRMEHKMVTDKARSRIVLFGGRKGQTQLLGDTWEWDGTRWSQLEDLGPAPRCEQSMAYDIGRRCIVLFGGLALGGNSYGDTWELSEYS